MSTPPVHESILLGLSPVIAATSLREVAQAVVALQKGEPLSAPLGAHQDALLRFAWLVFVRAPSLNMAALAVLPVRLKGAAASPTGDLLPGLLDYLRTLEAEAASPDSTLKGIEILKAPAARGPEVVGATGDALKALVEEAMSTIQRSGQIDRIIEEATDHVKTMVQYASEPQGPSDEVEATPREESVSWVEEGLSLHDDQDLEGALEAFNSAVEADPTHVTALICRAATLDMMGHAQGANDDYQAALALGPNVRAYASYGDFLLRHEKLDAAFGLFTTALSMNPDDLTSLHDRGMILRAAGRLAEARADYQRASELSPEQVNTWLNLGHVAVEAGDPEAESHFDRALALSPELPEALFGRARAREQKGDTAGAAADRELAAPGQQHEADRLHDLARWRMVAGNVAACAADLREALKVSPPDWPMREEVEATLQRLPTA